MQRHVFKRAFLWAAVATLAISAASCTKSPEQVRAWMRDKRAPVKMKEFIENKRFSLESKVEAVMVLVERHNSPEIITALDSVRADELNDIVKGVIERMDQLIETDAYNYETKVKDAAYSLLQLELTDDSREKLVAFIKQWLDGDNFFLPIEKSGRVEHERLFKLLALDSLPIYEKALLSKLAELEEALKTEAEKEAEMRESGKKYRVLSRPSDRITESIAKTLASLNELKLPGSHDMVAKIFVEKIEATYPDMPLAFALPFRDNSSELLLPVAKRILNDENYQSNTLNYFKNVMTATYFKMVQKDAGEKLCTQILETDRTGYLRWDCLELLSSMKGRDGVVKLIQSLPNDYSILATPEDHPTFVARPSMSFWNSLLVYCTHLPQTINAQAPLDSFRLIAQDGNAKTISRLISLACLSTIGAKEDVEFMKKLSRERANISDWGMQVSTIGQLATYTSRSLENRYKILAERKAQEEERLAALAKEAEEAKADDAAKADDETEEASANEAK